MRLLVIGSTGSTPIQRKSTRSAMSGNIFPSKRPLNLPRSPQGRPVIVQAGGSEGGKALGSRHADAIFCTQTTLEDGIAFYNEMKDRARAWGRNPEHLKIMPGLSTVIASTEAEAHRRCDELDTYQGSERPPLRRSPSALAFRSRSSTSTRRCRGTAWATSRRRRRVHTASSKPRSNLPGARISRCGSSRNAFAVVIVWWWARPNKSPIRSLNGSRPERAMASILCPTLSLPVPKIFVDHVVPLLRKRGVFRQYGNHTGTTLRDHLGLPRPASQYATTPSIAAS